MKIIGAGLSGLIAGALIPGSTIYEAQSELPNNHGAVLRFRSNKISKALNIPFKKVRVTKAIWYDGGEVQPTPRIQNMYSQKCTGSYSGRSISDISPVDRYIAPVDFIQQLAERCDVVTGTPWHAAGFKGDPGPIISTIPMPVMINQMFDKPEYEWAKFKRAPIWSRVHTVPGANLYQTIYFPGSMTGVYRASFTGDSFIVECTNNHGAYLPDILRAFGMPGDTECYNDKIIEEKYGKIIDIDPHIRRSIMATLTHEHNIYSLGRFATWRNILLDDVFDDIYKIMDLIKLDSYSRRLATAEEK